jgi:hypothetical protein
MAGFTGVVASGNQSAALGGIYFLQHPTPSTTAVAGQPVVVESKALLAGDVFGVRGSEITYSWSPAGSTPTAPSTTYTASASPFDVVVTAYYSPLSISEISNTVTITPIDASHPTDPPVLVSPPVSKVLPAGGGASFTLLATGTVTSYQWQRLVGQNWENVPGSINTPASSTLWISDAACGTYRVLASNVVGALRDADGNPVLPEFQVRSWPEFAGSYQGLLLNSAQPTPEADSPTDVRHPGRISLTVSATGSFSGQLEYQGQTHSLAGTLDSSSLSFQRSIARGALPALDFSLTLQESDLEDLTFSATISELLRTVGSTRVAWLERSTLSPTLLNSATTLRKAAGASSAVAGKTFSVVFQGSSTGSPTPGGHAVLSVSPSGLLSFSARIGDGAEVSLSSSTPVLENDEVAFFRSVYGIGHVAGRLRLQVPADPLAADTNAVSAIDGGLEWKQPGILESVSVTFQGSGYVLTPVVVFTGGSGSGALASATLLQGKVVGITLLNPGYGYAPGSPDVTVRVVKSASQTGLVKDALATARIAPGFTRKLVPYGALYTPPASVQDMTAASMLGASSESQITLRAFSAAGEAFQGVLPAGTWGLDGASVIKPTTSLTAAWSASGGTQQNAASSVSQLVITPTAASPLRSLAFRLTSGSTSNSLSPSGVVIQTDIYSGGQLVVPRGLYGVVQRPSLPWAEWTLR